MPSKIDLRNPTTKKHLLQLLGVLIAFLVAITALDKINSSLDRDINKYETEYYRRLDLIEQQKEQSTQSATSEE